MRTLNAALKTIVLLVVATALSGCFVTSQQVPAGAGPVNDPQLVGHFQGLDENGKPDPNVYLHFVKTDADKPLTFIMVDEKSWLAFELTTVLVGNNKLFAAKQLYAPQGDELEPGYILGFYKAMPNELQFNLLDTTKLKELIDAGKLKGRVETGIAGKVILTGSPDEIGKFLAGANAADLVSGDKPARARRIR